MPDGDNRPRYICTSESCGFIHYQNPKVVAGCIVDYRGDVLLCKRAIDPRRGLWTFPAGFLENGETVDEGAMRETLEEACAAVDACDLFGVYNIAHVNQVYIVFRASLAEPQFAPGEESLETELFSEADVPWPQIAFKVVSMALERYFRQRRSGDFRPFIDDVSPMQSSR